MLVATPNLPTRSPDGLAAVVAGVERRLAELLAAERDRWSVVDPALGHAVELLSDYVLAGGKRLRPAFCTWGFLAAGGAARSTILLDTNAALELLHAFALLHDDVMDGSERRRGQPALHRRLADDHADARWNGEARRFGDGMAILLGDLAFAYADRLLRPAGPEVQRVWDDLKVELTMGQYLDVRGAASGQVDVAMATRIAAFKSGRYTVERPLELGAALAGGLDELGPHLRAYGAPLGEAFQFRDDLLGVFGEADATGKPVGDDLREGKPTLLLAEARRRTGGADLELLGRIGSADLGAPEVAALQELLDRCGARAAVEAAIDGRLERAHDALDQAPIDELPKRALRGLADRCTRRAA
jgi:geranylgeranyl diphosphate synthase type I